jgi:hypothetical protein
VLLLLRSNNTTGSKKAIFALKPGLFALGATFGKNRPLFFNNGHKHVLLHTYGQKRLFSAKVPKSLTA